jgi:hypothetical protein
MDEVLNRLDFISVFLVLRINLFFNCLQNPLERIGRAPESGKCMDELS